MKQTKTLLILFTVLSLLEKDILAKICSRYPSHTTAPKSPVDENYAILVQGNPQTYILGAEYRISLEASNGARFIGFLLALENDQGGSTYMEDLGTFQIVDDVETQYSQNCYNMVESTNTNTKTHIEVKWTAPMEPGKGCILIRATVLQSRDIWYMDDGGLTRRICEEIVDDVESSGLSTEVPTCCACDEASYDILFEGLWSRNLHPKDFPAQGFLTRFSDIIGASHASDYRFWEYGQLAKEGMKEFAEYGSLRTLQREFNYYFKNGKIRTIVRARGPAFPNLNSLSVSTVRVDAEHHLLSLASKIDPSPDWIVGISGLELCLSNCTWLLEKTISLYPWDIGTDAGPSYLSPDQPQVPPDVIRRIRHDYPNDPRYPFFDESGTPMKPLASLTVRRKRIYERDCEDTEADNNKDLPKECSTHPFNAWSECSSSCGQGVQWRKRVYKQPEVAKVYGCDSLTRNYLERTCYGTRCGKTNEEGSNPYQEDNSPEVDCKLSAWTAWSTCSRTCGEGKMMRKRQYLNEENEEICQSERLRKLIQYKKCVGRNCLGEEVITSEEVNDFETNFEDDNYERKPKQQVWFKKPRLEETAHFMRKENRNPEEEQDAYENESFYRKPTKIEFDEEEQQKWSRKNKLEEAENSAWKKWNRNPIQTRYENEEEQDTDEDANYQRNPTRNSFDEEEQQKWSRKPKLEEAENLVWGKKNRNSAQIRFENEEEAQESYENNEVNRNDEEVQNMSGEEEYPQLPPPASLGKRRPQRIVDCCFEPLQLYRCADSKVVGNFWTYNYCEDECMLYASNNCDMNKNKFKSLEECESNCRTSQHYQILQEKQQEECFDRPRSLRF